MLSKADAWERWQERQDTLLLVVGAVVVARVDVHDFVSYQLEEGFDLGFKVRVPEVLKRNFKPGFMAKLQHKDLNIALAAGKDVGAPLPVTAIVNEMYRALITGGGGDLDTSALVTVTEKLAGVEVRGKG